AQCRHPVLDGPWREVLRKPALDQLLDMLGLEAVGVHMPESHLVELVGDQIEDVLPIRLGGVAAVAVMPAELLQVIVQIAHRYLLSFPFIRAAKIVVERFVLWCRGVCTSGKCFCSPGAPVAAAGGTPST